MPKITALRGATSAENSPDSIHERTQELVIKLIEENNIQIDNIIYFQLQRTPDLDAMYPATAVRELYPDVPVIGGVEHPIGQFDTHLIRVVILIDLVSGHGQQKSIYLHGVSDLKKKLDSMH